MPLKMLYEQLLSPAPRILQENSDADSYHLLEESHLQAMWYEQKYMLPLKTVDGKKIEVVSPGLWNSTKGPDFCKAHLKIDGKEIFGDIEIHLHEDDWKQHKHHEDPYYNSVVLHVAYWYDDQATISTQNNLLPARVVLEKQTTLPPHRIIENLDLDLYPYKEFLGSGKCAETIFSELDTEDIHSFFKSAAHWRLKKKYESMTKNMAHKPYCFATGIVSVLGYRHNSKSFVELFKYLLLERNLPEDMLLSLAMGICGFFEKKHAMRWQDSCEYRKLQSHWGELISRALHQTNLRLDGIRPYNHPVRRLVLLVKMLQSNLGTMEQPLMDLWDESWEESSTPQLRKKLLQDMLLRLPIYDDPYWNTHFTFEPHKQDKYISLLGDETRLQIVTNVFLPLLFDKVKKKADSKEIEAFDQFFIDLPEISTGKRQYLSHRFFGENASRKIEWSAAIEQGAYQLHTDFCMNYESSCVGCPFIDRMHKLLKIN